MPLGRYLAVPSVRGANIMVAWQAILLYVWTALGFVWLLEQPRTSLMEKHPHMEAYFKAHRTWRVSLNLGDFGAKTQNTVWIYSNMKLVLKLPSYAKNVGEWRQYTDNKLVDVGIKSDGGRAITGRASELKESQAYPRGYGEAVAQWYADHAKEIQQHADACRAVVADDCDVDLRKLLEMPHSRPWAGPWRKAICHKH